MRGWRGSDAHEWPSESRVVENRQSDLIKGGATVIGLGPINPSASLSRLPTTPVRTKPKFSP